MFALVAFMCLAPVACSTFYRSVVSLTSVVDGAAKEYAKAFNDGLVPPEVAAKASTAHLQYRQAAGVAHDAFVAAKAGQTVDTKAALEAARAAASSFIAVLVPLLSKDRAASLQTQLAKAVKP